MFNKIIAYLFIIWGVWGIVYNTIYSKDPAGVLILTIIYAGLGIYYAAKYLETL